MPTAESRAHCLAIVVPSAIGPNRNPNASTALWREWRRFLRAAEAGALQIQCVPVGRGEHSYWDDTRPVCNICSQEIGAAATPGDRFPVPSHAYVAHRVPSPGSGDSIFHIVACTKCIREYLVYSAGQANARGARERFQQGHLPCPLCRNPVYVPLETLNQILAANGELTTSCPWMAGVNLEALEPNHAVLVSCKYRPEQLPVPTDSIGQLYWHLCRLLSHVAPVRHGERPRPSYADVFYVIFLALGFNLFAFKLHVDSNFIDSSTKLHMQSSFFNEEAVCRPYPPTHQVWAMGTTPFLCFLYGCGSTFFLWQLCKSLMSSRDALQGIRHVRVYEARLTNPI
ncbi:MAG: hypothetical protein AAF550_01770 [Myxococcota bacterium]